MKDRPAFPTTDCRLGTIKEGMTLREYYAGQALIGLLILSPEICKANNVTPISKEDMAENCFMYADALIKQLEDSK